MAFRGPSGALRVPALEFAQEDEARLRQEEQLQRSADADYSRQWASNVQDFQRREERRREEQASLARYATTPGIRRGGDTDPATNDFEVYGERFAYDPVEGARIEGRAKAEGEAEAERVRFERLLRIPGMDRRMASRLVYGRGAEMDDPDPAGVRQALATYVRQPTRENAARVIERGGAINQFPDRFLAVRQDPDTGYELPLVDRSPARGTAEYLAALEAEQGVRTSASERLAAYRAGLRPAARDRMSRVSGPNGEIGRLNLDTGEVEWTGEMGARPGGPPSPLDAMVAARMGGSAAATPATVEAVMAARARGGERAGVGADTVAAPVAAPAAPQRPVRLSPMTAPPVAPRLGGVAAARQAPVAGDRAASDRPYVAIDGAEASDAELEAAFQAVQRRLGRAPTRADIENEVRAMRAMARRAARTGGGRG